MELSSNARLTDWVRSSLDLDNKSSDQVLRNNLLDTLNIEVTKSPVPERQVKVTSACGGHICPPRRSRRGDSVAIKVCCTVGPDCGSKEQASSMMEQ